MGFFDKALSSLGLQRKDAPDYGRYAYAPLPFDYQYRWYSPFRPTDELKAELGQLDGNSLVMAVVNYVGIRLPEAKPTVQKRGKDGKMDTVDPHALSNLIRRPNQLFIWANYSLALSLSWWIDGNVYFYKNRAISGVAELWYLPHFLVIPRWPNDGRAPAVPLVDENGQPSDPVLSHYEYRIPGTVPILYPKRDILHIKRGVNLANVRSGVSAFEPLIKELYGDDKMASFTAAIMRNMGIQVPIISPKDQTVSIDPANAAAMKEGWIRKTTGASAGEPVIMTEPIDVAKFGFSPTELDLSKLRLIPESRVSAVTGIPAATLQLMVGLEHGTSYASSAQMRQQGYEEVIIPIQGAIAEEINWQLMPEFEKDGTATFSFDTSKVRVLQEDQDALMKRATVGYLGGVLKRGEARVMVGHEETPDDDVFFEPRGSGVIQEGEDPTAASTQAPGKPVAAPPKKFGSYADIDRYLENLESQMKGFVVDA